MRKKFILLPFAAALAYLTLSSNSNGTLQSSTWAGCPSCHTASSNTTISSITLTNQSNGQLVTNGQYTPGTVYTVTMTGANATQPNFGFQLRARNTSSVIVGTMTATQVGTVVSNSLLTHSSPRTIVSGVATVTATWTAPAAGAGTITIEGIINAVNLNGNNTGDMVSSIFSTVFNEAATVPPVPSVIPVGPITACAGQVPQLIATSSGATSFQWKLNGNNISGATSSTFTPTQSGTYTVTASNSVGTSAVSNSVQVTVNPVPVMSATHSSASVCPGKCDTITLTGAITYSLSTNPQSMGTVVGNRVIVCPGTSVIAGAYVFNINGTSSGCTGSTSQTVNVLARPTAAFTHTHTGLTYTFTSTSTGAVSYQWTVNPGALTSTQQNPVITLPATGNYTVTLTVTNASGCTHTTTQNLTALSVTGIPGGENFFFGPNPAAGVLHIRSGGLNAELNLYDYTGRFVRRLSTGSPALNYDINIEDIPSGFYLLQIKARGAAAIERLIIRR